jgi:hypothetical protein
MHVMARVDPRAMMRFFASRAELDLSVIARH